MEEINGLARCEFVVFQKDSFMIAKFKALEDFENMPEGSFSVKGDMAVKVGLEYTVHATLDSSNQKYKNSYSAIRVASDVDLSGASKSDIEKFLSEVSTPTRAKSIMTTFDNPIEILENRDIEALVEAKGITASVASDIIDAYFSQKDYSEAIIEFQKYNLTTKTIINICKQFGSADLAIKMVNDNPYCLSALDGFGFTKADNVFLSDPENRPEDHRRVEAYIKFMFEKEYDEGNTWISPADMIAKLKEFIPMADHKYAVEYVRDSEEFVVERVGEDIHISSREMYNVEVEIAENLNRLMSAKCTINLSRYRESIRATESVNGWEYDESQVQAIDNMVEKNVYMLQGLGGTGKTATIRAFLNAVEAGGYQFSSCALSGKASQNLTISTGKQGYTIHSLLGASIGGFAYNENMPLQADVVVLDELSMVNMRIFLSLIKAIKSGAKLIMLGDYGQLEAIGVGVMGGLITSKCVPMSLLKKIHRQAQDSAIITHSIAVRNGLLPSGMSLEVDESKVYGVKQDLEYTLVDKEDEDKIFDYAMDKFKLSLDKYPIEDIQIICSTKTTGVVSTYELNKSAQYHYNPYKGTGEQVELGFNDHKYFLRVNDKVINMKNNKLTESPEGIERHIYNGSTGIVRNITVEGKNYSLIIDFDGIGEVVVEGKALNFIQLGYAMTVHKCITDDTWIYTDKGLKQMHELNNGAEVGEFRGITNDIMVYNGSELERPKSFYNAGVSPIKKIVTNKGYQINATEEHGIDIVRGDELVRVRADELRVGDRLAISMENNVFGDNTKLPEEWNKQSKLDIHSKRYNKPTEMTKDFARFLGYMVADGTVARRTIKFSKRNREVSEDFRRVVFDIFGYYKEHLPFRKSGDHMYEVGSADIANFCRNIDGIHPHSKFVPQCVLEAPEEFQREFLKAVFEDGTVNVKDDRFDHIEMSAKDELLIDQIRMMLLNMGIISTKKLRMRKHKDGKVFPQYHLYIYKFDSVVYERKIGFISHEKNDRLSMCCVDYGYKQSGVIVNKEYGKLFVDEITSIDDGVENTYCLEMPLTHKFIQNGIHAYNCQGSTIKCVIFALPYHYLLNTKELVYTGMTRASEMQYIITSPRSFKRAIKNTSVKKKKINLARLIADELQKEQIA